ncbi:MAG: homogentisate 1,2-dioxygenase [Proteobacteria bacterium]|nr:homogentisate 1,2-dioxygenase [Pseudomonadota bacterium]
MKDWITLPKTEGTASRQAHADLPDGTYERELGREGFAGAATHMYHRHPPTSWTAWEGPLRPRAFDLRGLDTTGGGPWQASAVLHNGNTRVRFWRADADMDCLVRNGDGDDLIFVHEGRGDFFTDYGHMPFRDGDYLLVPRGTMWRVEIEEPLSALMIEATGAAFRLPEKGIVGHHAIFDPAVLDYPRIDDPFLVQQDEGEWRVEIKRHGKISTVTYPFNPLDAVGWSGTLMPLKLNWRDIRPLMSHRYHLPPSAHTTFLTDTIVVSTFCPRPLESDPGALKVPFFHSNDDYDEVIFYHRGEFFSRDNIKPGMMTLHPSGFPHGPHPKALRSGARGDRTETDEVAVMIDVREAFEVAPLPEGIEWLGYVDSWREEAAE